MRDLIKPMIHSAIEMMKEDSKIIRPHLWDESQFRYFLMKAFKAQNPVNTRVQREWHLVDLLLQTSELNIAVELKYYQNGYTYSLDGLHRHKKGGHGVANYTEFWTMVATFNEKLNGILTKKHENRSIHHKVGIMAYERKSNDEQKGFDDFYDDLTYDINRISMAAKFERLHGIPLSEMPIIEVFERINVFFGSEEVEDDTPNFTVVAFEIMENNI